MTLKDKVEEDVTLEKISKDDHKYSKSRKKQINEGIGMGKKIIS